MSRIIVINRNILEEYKGIKTEVEPEEVIVPVVSQYSCIPYLVESRVTKSIFQYLKGLGRPFHTKNGKIVDINNDDWSYMIEKKIARLNITELYLFQEELNKGGCEWGVNYLVGGIRNFHHLCWVESKTKEEIRHDWLIKPYGVSIF